LEFRITQSSSDADILFYIKKELGFGSVRKQDIKSNTHCFRVRDKNNLYKLICIFNGNIFLTEKRKKFRL
jgi:LAGLIDADG endonuclease